MQPDAPLEIGAASRRLVMVGTLAALFVAAIGQTVVATALPSIVADLGDLDLLSWVFTSYLLTSTIVVLVAGKLGDQFGRKPLFLLAIVFFSAGSAASGVSQSMTQLLIFRAVQGVGGGMLFATSFAVVGDLYAPLERGRIQGLFAGVFGLASVVGPTLGGWVTDSATWRWVFFLNLPVAVVAFLIILWSMPRMRMQQLQRPKVDVAGVVLISAVLVPLLLAFALGGNQYPWGSREITQLFGSSALMLVLFIAAERGASEPILPLSLFRNRTFVVSAMVTFLVGAGMFGAITMVPLFLQGVTGIAATSSGTLMIPMMLSMVTSAAVSGQLMTRTGRYKWLAIYSGVATAAALLLFSTIGAETSRLEMVRNMILLGLALGPSLPVFTVAVQNALPFEMLGIATAGSQFFRQLGGTVGVAAFTTLMLTRFRDGIADVASSVPAIAASPNALLNAQAVEGVRATYESTAAPGAQPFDAILAVVRLSMADAIAFIFLVAAVFAAVAAVITFVLPELELRATSPAEMMRRMREASAAAGADGEAPEQAESRAQQAPGAATDAVRASAAVGGAGAAAAAGDAAGDDDGARPLGITDEGAPAAQRATPPPRPQPRDYMPPRGGGESQPRDYMRPG